ncbi:branched-chain amino acid ABC transporter permease [Candidatus Acetothermia bacterium]|nr:branched-chain amino acid ABC transporter permease [Candidatus Acetothermia bacterium]
MSRKGIKYLLLLGLVALLTILPLIPGALNTKWMTTITFATYFAIFVLGWDILCGYTGQISFGHSFFVGASGYTSALLSLYFKWPIWATIPCGVLASLALGLLLSVPALRLRGPYFSLITLIMPLIAIKLVLIFSSITGGELGKSNIPAIPTPVPPCPSDAGPDVCRALFIQYQQYQYYYALGLMALVAIALLIISTSRIGKILEAIRDNEEAVEAAGINTAKFKILAFGISSFVVGLGGAFYVHYLETVLPQEVLSPTRSTEIIIASVLGGMGTIIGPLFGAYAVRLGQEGLREAANHIPALQFLNDWALFIFLALLIVLIFVARQGVLPALVGAPYLRKLKKFRKLGQQSVASKEVS